jgi:hypothetical protein
MEVGDGMRLESIVMPRFVLLEHRNAPDDPAGLHFDFLVEDGDACRTWRLAALPPAGGGEVVGTEIARHRLAWLDAVDEEVSGGRGRVRRVTDGTCAPVGPEADTFEIDHGPFAGRIVIVPCRGTG